MSSTIRVAVLTVSDTCGADPTQDKSGPAIRVRLGEEGAKFTCKHHTIVADDVNSIQAEIKKWVAGEDVDLILTTGGTGFGTRDVTPEAVNALLERHAPGLVHLLLSDSLNHTRMAALSRPVAGTIGKLLIVTLPGSVKAVKENLEALFSGGIIDHAIELIRGGTGKTVHAALAESGSSTSSTHRERHRHHHHHSHEHKTPTPRSTLSHDPSAAVSARHRSSPYPIVSLEEALARIEEHVATCTVVNLPVNADLKDHILADDVYAPSNAPPTSTTSVDGYALRSTDPPGQYTVLTSQSHKLSDILPANHIYRINTGGSLPAGTDTVIMVEDTNLISTLEEGEEQTVETLAQIPAGENVRMPGSDVKQGDLVLQKGVRISSVGGEIGSLAFVGRKEVEVYLKPVVAILSTGDEISDLHDSEGKEDGIWDTNRPSLQAALEGMGYQVLDLGIVTDNIEAHVSAITTGLNKADIIVTTGGTSMGPTDLLKPVIERNFGGTIHFGRVAVKPGKPTTFATIPHENKQVPVFALPGNPASALVTFQIFVVPALRQLGGWPKELRHLPRMDVKIESSMPLDPRVEFHRVIIKATSNGLVAYSTGGQRSSRVASLSGANGLVILPKKTADGPNALEAGSTVQAVVIGELQMA